MASVIIYSTPTCGFCHQEKDWLDELGVNYSDNDITQDAAAYQEVLDKAGQPVTPVTDIDGTIIVGFDREALKKRLLEVGLIKEEAPQA